MIHSLVSVIDLPWHSQSLDRSLYRKTATGEPFLLHLLNSLPTADAGNPTVLLCHTDEDNESLQDLTITSGLEKRYIVVRARLLTEVAWLAEVATESGATDLALLPLSSCIAPCLLLKHLWTHHLQARNTVTLAEGLPKGMDIVILDRNVLTAIADLSLPGAPVPTVTSLCRRLVTMDLSRVGLSVKGLPLDCRALYGIRDGCLPDEIIDPSTEEGFALTYRVISEHKEETDDLTRFCRWKSLALHRHEDVLCSLLEPHTIRHSCVVAHDRLRVLYVSNPAAFSGAEQSLCQLVRHIDKQRFDTYSLVGGNGYFARRLESAGSTVRVIPDGFGTRNVITFLTLVRLIGQEIKPDIVHLNAYDGAPMLWSTVLYGIPIIQHIRNAHLREFKENIETADFVITVSDYLKERVLRYRISPQKVQTIYDEVDPEEFYPGVIDKRVARRILGVPAGVVLVVVIARFAENKRHDLVLKAMPEVIKAIPTAHLFVTGELFATSATIARRFGQLMTMVGGGQATYRPFIDDIRVVHAAADVLVLCSEEEGLGRCVVEAMAMGVPCVVSDTGGAREIIQHRHTGLLVTGGNAGAIAEALIDLLIDHTLASEMSRNARRFVVAELSTHRSANKVMEIYEQVVLKRRAFRCIPHA